ncbi:MAG TPA: RNA polymerase sigma factor [Candidatus Limnocylindrales bacterium]|nr:RNA polymerase sigma factor [Candidatus Limnocylindrales bacterium]
MDTTELVKQAQHGDEEAFASLSIVIGNRLHAIAHRILRDADLADDATQQALLSIWRDLPQLRDPGRFEGWAYRLLVRACYAEGKKVRRWAPNLRVLHPDDAADTGGIPSVADRDQLERAFRQLSVDHRAVVVLHHYLGLSLDEAAEALGVPIGTIRSRLFYAMRALRAALDADARPVTREAIR